MCLQLCVGLLWKHGESESVDQPSETGVECLLSFHFSALPHPAPATMSSSPISSASASKGLHHDFIGPMPLSLPANSDLVDTLQCRRI